MQITRPELHAYGLRAYLDAGREAFGDQALHDILQAYGVTADVSQDPDGWISLEFIEALIGDIATRSGDPDIVDRAARASISQKYLGPIYTLLRTFGNVASTYEQVARSTPRFNKTGTYELQQLGPGRIRLDFFPAVGIGPERTHFMCRNRRVQLATVPTIFDLPPAEVEDPRCILRGDPCCTYVLAWTLPARRWRSKTLAVAGGAIAGGACVFVGLETSVVAWAGGLFALGGWLAGRNLELRQDLGDRVRDLADHQQALARSMRAQEQRFAELLDAKSQVEKRVEERTAELQSATARLSETLQEIQALDRAKTDFFNNVSHELRSPLTMIVAPLEDLAAGRTPPGGPQAAFESMRHNARRLLQLINQLLDLAKIDAGEMKIAPMPTDIPTLVRRALEGFETAVDRKGVTLAFSCPSDMPPVAIDAPWIESAFTNLMANALRLTPSGRGIRVAIEDSGAEVSISVSDDGPGIAPEDHAKIFARFAQGDSTKRLVGGTGIGLALVREALRLHDGDVTLSSELGKGATFVLKLPRRALSPRAGMRSTPPVPLERSANVHDDIARAEGRSDRPGPTPDAPIAIVVEDNADLRGFISDVLAAQYRVRGAADGKEGLALALALDAEVVVSDVAMPEMDGLELCRALRASPRTHSVPILLVTARTEVSSILEGFDAGANDYILKPFHGRELLARIDVHVRVRRLAEQLALRERHAMLGTTAAAVAHQVRNPLTALVGGLPAMRSRVKDRVDERTLELIDVMLECATRIERLTHDLMDVSRVDREAAGPYKPSDGLRSCVRMTQARASATDLAFQEAIDESPVIEGRPGDMNHVFMNLLDNAARAAGPNGKIKIDASVSQGHYVVDIGDSGPGVDPQHLPRIFEAFFTTRPAGEGTGLGLAVAKQVMQQCGGRIDVARSDLGGALFTVRIPLTRVEGSVRAQGVGLRLPAS